MAKKEKLHSIIRLLKLILCCSLFTFVLIFRKWITSPRDLKVEDREDYAERNHAGGEACWAMARLRISIWREIPDFKNRDKKQVAIEEIAIKVSWFRFVHTVRKMPLEAKNIKKWEVFSFRPWVAKFHENSAAYKRKQLDKRPYQVVFGGLLKQSKYWRAELALENRVETFLDAYPNSEPLSRLK